ncbi:MAG: hemolysin family protein [Ruminococcus sp.]|nr:hemolysin family protein [Ruminococcus sp.]
MDSDSSGAAVCIALAVLILARVFFSCCERACTEISDSKVKSFEKEKGNKGLLFGLLESPSSLRRTFAAHRLINSMLFSLALYKAVLEKILINQSLTLPARIAAAAAAALAAAVILLSVGDGVPAHTVKGKKAENLAAAAAPLVSLLKIILLPVTGISSAVSKTLSKLLGADIGTGEDPVTEEEILMLVDAGNETGAIESSEKEMINNVFEFHDMTVSEVMTHRTDIVAVSVESEITEVVYAAINSGFSRIPVYKDSIDHIEGIIYVKDLLCLVSTGTAESASVKDFLRDAEYVPESSMCGELFHAMTAGHFQLAVAVDEYGGTAGLVTMEDLVEAIVGSIQDEYDNEAEDISEISENTYAISGTANPEDVMETLSCPLPEDSEYDTMSGFITDLLGRIPEDGETPSVKYKNILFTVILAEDMRIERIKAVKNPPETESVRNEK